MQVNIYRWLVYPEYSIDRLEIVYIDMKGTVRCPVRVMSLEYIEKFILPRARLVKRGLEGEELPPQVGNEGRWQCWGYCAFSHHEDCWGEAGPPERNRRESKEESRNRAIRRSYARRNQRDREKSDGT
jgi:hypothetical protein